MYTAVICNDVCVCLSICLSDCDCMSIQAEVTFKEAMRFMLTAGMEQVICMAFGVGFSRVKIVYMSVRSQKLLLKYHSKSPRYIPTRKSEAGLTLCYKTHSLSSVFSSAMNWLKLVSSGVSKLQRRYARPQELRTGYCLSLD